MQWRDATRAAELAERLAEIATEAADHADRSALASDQIARMADKAAVAAERAARSARKAARQAADLAIEHREQRLPVADEALVTARASEAQARGRYHEAELTADRHQGLPASTYHLAHDGQPNPRGDRGSDRPLRSPP